MRGVLEAQAVFDQTRAPGLGHDLVEEGLIALETEAASKLRQEPMRRQLALQREIEKEAKGDVDLGVFEHLSVGEVVLELEEFEFEHQHGVFGGPSHL